MILYIENPKDSTKKTVRIKKFSKIVGYIISIQKSNAFLRTNKKLLDRNVSVLIKVLFGEKYRENT